ncbi:putative UPF0496 protein 2 [Typha latifolia]|uniref:putative UPF0496 protein 2 n=1 Tax=Typha latifolia TaxID=4733 RepID=UPI003C2CBFFF
MGMWHKLRSASVNSSLQRSAGVSMERFNTTVNVEEEYNKALRTNSFIDLWSKSDHHHHHHHLRRSISSSPPPPLTFSTKFHLDPSQDSLLSAASGFRAAALLLDFFDATLDASNACISLLDSIALARNHHRSISNLLLRLLSLNKSNNNKKKNNTFADLARRVELDNPLSPPNLSPFHTAHRRYPPLVVTLAAAHKKFLRRARIIRMIKKASRFILIGACGAAIAAALVFALHATLALGVAITAAAAARERQRRRRREGCYEKASLQLDAAAKGAYIVERDLDTMSRMVRRAHDEIEHGRDVARIVLRSGGEREVVREVAKEVEEGEVELGEQLEELEEHVCLCLVTINRSRRLVAQEMMP